MPKYIRTIIMWIFILAFFIITPLVLLYTNGWRYNWKKGKAERTGTLIIDITPQNSDVYVNGHLLERLIPFTTIHLDNLQNGDYQIKIEKEGYFPWEKTLQVNNEFTTFINKVVLFPQNPIHLIKENKNIVKIIKFFNNDYLIYIKKDKNYLEFILHNLKDQKDYLIYRSLNLNNIDIEKITYLDFEFSAKQNYLLIKPLKILFDLEKKKILNIDIKSQISHFNPNENNKLYYYKNNNILLYSFNDKTSKIIYKNLNNIKDFLIHKNKIYFINQDNQLYLIENKSEKRKKIYEFPQNENLAFYSLNTNEWLVYNSHYSYFFQDKNNKLYLKKLESHQLYYSPYFNKIAYNHNNEIWTWEDFNNPYKDAKSYLLARFSSNIKDIEWYPNNEYLIFAIDDTVKIIELDGRGNYRNQYTIYKTNKAEEKILRIKLYKNYLYIFTNKNFYYLNIMKKED